MTITLLARTIRRVGHWLVNLGWRLEVRDSRGQTFRYEVTFVDGAGEPVERQTATHIHVTLPVDPPGRSTKRRIYRGNRLVGEYGAEGEKEGGER